MYKRELYQIVKQRIEEPRNFIQVLAGPRQVGKTTLMEQILKEVQFPYTSEAADGVSSITSEWISDVWNSARSKMDFRGESEHLLVIDEIQKLSNWSETVKKEWDRDTREHRNLKVVILGSSRLMLMKGLTESLAGRFELIRMGHWDYTEMRDAFGWTLDQYIYFGGYPGTASLIEDENRWKRYVGDSLVESAISKDVLMTSTIYKPALLRQLFELGCSYSGELLSLNKMLGQLQDAGNVTTLAGYLRLLEQCNLLAGLHKYANDAARKYASIPKYQVYNNALHTLYAGTSFENERINPKRWGRWVESAVGAYLINHAETVGYRMYYWREKSDEVDFVLVKNENTVAIEVKSGRRGYNNGLPLFREQFHPGRSFIVGTGGISVEEFLTINLDLLF
ncbi:MAG: AAA family ATPase [Bacteroidales bacterium]|nr:AAA family ATPase [Bacteroidales bacterium]